MGSMWNSEKTTESTKWASETSEGAVDGMRCAELSRKFVGCGDVAFEVFARPWGHSYPPLEGQAVLVVLGSAKTAGCVYAIQEKWPLQVFLKFETNCV